MERYLLDTNILSDAIRAPKGRVAQRIRYVGPGVACTSIIVAAELRYGAAKRRSRRLTVRVTDLLDTLQVIPFEPPADIAYGDLRTHLEQAGTPIGTSDMLIAAHALSLGLTLVTDNEREFARVSGLRIENWLR